MFYMKKVSIIIPVYRAAETLENTVSSILSQSYKDLEIILVNDGSPDNSLEVCRKIEQNNPGRVRVFDKENGGVVSAYKMGIKNAQGDYIAFCDADDTYKQDYLSHGIEIIEKYNCDFISYGCTICSQTNHELVLNSAETGFYDKQRIREEILPHCLFNIFDPAAYYKVLVYRWNKIYKKELIDRFVDKLDENCYQIEDNVFTTLAILNAESFYIENISFYNYILQEKSITKGYSKELFERYLYSLEILKKLTNENLSQYNPKQFELLAFENLRIAFRRCAKSAGYKQARYAIKKIRTCGYIDNIKLSDIKLSKNYLFYFPYKLHLNYCLYMAFKIL
jgi:glycosyltransferase involved in cell wall biosynthesis